MTLTIASLLYLARKKADPELTPLMLARRFRVAVDRVRLVLRAAGLYPTRPNS